MSKPDDITPIDGSHWTMHPNATRTSSRPDIATPNTLERVLAAVEEVLAESRLIKESSQRACQIAIDTVAAIPRLEKRMTRVELLAIAFAAINIAMLIGRSR